MIAAVATVYNEADIIEPVLRHLFAEGVEMILLADASTDETTEIIRGLQDEFPGLQFEHDAADYHFQPAWINALAGIAGRHGAEWVIPFDADEFWYAPSGDTIAGELETVPAGVTKIAARQYQHLDWEHRHVDPAPHPKCAVRWSPLMSIRNGNHYIDGPGGMVWGPLELRELHFRSFEHMVRKSTERTVRIDPSLPWTEGTHQRVLHALDEAGKREAWAEWRSRSTVFDPVPARTQQDRSVVPVVVDLSEPSSTSAISL